MKQRPSRVSRAQSMLCKAAMAADMARIKEARRDVETVVAVPGQAGATLYVTVKR
jgi:hypothetical protein